MLDSLRISGGLAMDDHKLLQRRQMRKKRIDRTKLRGSTKDATSFFGSPYSAIVCMLVALGYIVGFWRGVPSWAILALGVGAVVIVIAAGFFWRSSCR